MVLILETSLRFTAITFLPEWEVEIITDNANPILYFILCVWFNLLVCIVFCGGEVIAHFFLFEFDGSYFGFVYNFNDLIISKFNIYAQLSSLYTPNY